MAYQRINFKNQSVERPRTYEMSHNADGSVTLVDSFGLVDELGTPINADTMGHIEDGIEAAAIRHYNSTETYNEKEWVLGSVDNNQTIFKSLIPSNIGNALTNQMAWEEVKLGSNGGAMPIGTVFPLNCSSSYVPEGCLPCDGAEYSKSQFKQLWDNYLIGKDVFDPDSITIVGNPTITSDGVASGLDFYNYINTSATFADIKDKSWTIKNRVYVDQTKKSFILIDKDYRTLGSVLYDNGIKFCGKFGDSNSSTNEIYVVNLGVVPIGWYDVSISFNISTGIYTLYAQNVETLVEYKNTYSPTTENKQLHSLNTKSSSTILRIGSGDVTNSLTCDLTKYSILIKDIFDSSSITVVGSPTITDDGIASGFSGSNYIKVTALPNYNTFEIIVPFKITANNGTETQIILSNGGTAKGFTVGKLANGSLHVSLSSDGSNNDIANGVSSSLLLELNTNYLLKIKFDGTKYTFDVSNDGINYTNYITVMTSLKVLNTNDLYLGYIGYWQLIYGLIDLKQFSITVDGQVVFDCVYPPEIIYDCVKQVSLLNTCSYDEYEQDFATYGQCSKFAVKPLEYDGSGLTIVGSPTITEDGFASGFVQGSSYITVNVSINASKIAVRNKFNYKVNTADNSMLYWFNGIALRQYIVNNGDLRIDGNASPASLYINVPASNFKENDVVETELIIADTVQLNIKVNGVALQQYTSERIPTLSNITQVGIGSSYYQGNNPYQGSIDLKGFEIEADGQTVFSGGVGDTFKVPTIKDGAVVQQAMSDSELGKAYNEGLPNITGKFAMNANSSESGGTAIEGAFRKTSRGSSAAEGDGATSTIFTMDASLSDSTYGKTDDTSLQKVQVNAVALRYFVVVANGILEDSQMDWSEWASSLQGKANKTDVDGQWIATGSIIISTNTAVGTYTLDLSEILPNDGYNYEVLIRYGCYSTNSSIPSCLRIGSDIITELMTIAYCGANGRYANGVLVLPVGQGRYITEEIYATAFSGAEDRYRAVCAYRRIGRNV